MPEATTQALATSAMDQLAEMIAQAAGDPSAAQETASQQPEQTINLVQARHGWGERYINRKTLSGDEWNAAFAKASKITQSGGFVALVGNRGTGKTQIAAEITRAGMFPPVSRKKWGGDFCTVISERKSIYRRAIDIFLDLRDASKNHTKRSEKQVLAELTDCGLLVIDEYQERGESEWENRILRNLIDKRYAEHRATIIIANLSRKQLFEGLGESVIDRARENGKSIECNWESFRGRDMENLQNTNVDAPAHD